MSTQLDTDTLVDCLRSRSIALSRFRIAYLYERPRTSSITVAELYQGAYRSTNPVLAIQDVTSLLAHVDSIPVDDDIARTFASLKVQLQRSGNIAPSTDL